MFDFGISLSMFFTILMYLDVSHVSVESLCMLSSNGFNGFFFPPFYSTNMEEEGNAYTRLHTRTQDLEKSRCTWKKSLHIFAGLCVQQGHVYRCLLNL